MGIEEPSSKTDVTRMYISAFNISWKYIQVHLSTIQSEFALQDHCRELQTFRPPSNLVMTTPDPVERHCRTGTLTLGEDLTNEARYSNKQEHIFALLLYPTTNPCCSRGGSPLIARKM